MGFALVELRKLSILIFDSFVLFLLELSFGIVELVNLVIIPLLVFVDVFKVDRLEHFLSLSEVLLLLL